MKAMNYVVLGKEKKGQKPGCALKFGFCRAIIKKHTPHLDMGILARIHKMGNLGTVVSSMLGMTVNRLTFQ